MKSARFPTQTGFHIPSSRKPTFFTSGPCLQIINMDNHENGKTVRDQLVLKICANIGAQVIQRLDKFDGAHKLDVNDLCDQTAEQAAATAAAKPDRTTTSSLPIVEKKYGSTAACNSNPHQGEQDEIARLAEMLAQWQRE